MGKISVSAQDSLIKNIEAESEKSGRNKSEVAAQAIEFWFGKGRTLEEKCLTLENQLSEAQKNFNLKENELFQQSKKFHALEKQIEELDRKLEEKQSTIQKLEDEILTLKNDAQEAQKTKVSFEATLQARADEISFLRGHVAQLTQLAQAQLPPSQEEARAKHWWKFWK